MKLYIFDWKRTLYDPDTQTLINGTIEVLEFLKQKHGNDLALVGKGGQDMHSEVKRLGVKVYFSYIDFREGSKDLNLYRAVTNNKSPKDIVFIGDRVKSEIAVGNSIGATTVWVKQGEFATELPETLSEQPTHTVNSLIELKELLQKL